MMQIIVGMASYNAGLTPDQALEVWAIMRDQEVVWNAASANQVFGEAVQQVKAGN